MLSKACPVVKHAALIKTHAIKSISLIAKRQIESDANLCLLTVNEGQRIIKLYIRNAVSGHGG